jgi:hypothetical protein
VANKARVDGVADQILSHTVGWVMSVTAIEPPLTQVPSHKQCIKYTSPGEMALQGFHNSHSTESAPQKLVQLVGFRDPNIRSESVWRRPRRTA